MWRNGRRIRLKIERETMRVRIPPSAPQKNHVQKNMVFLRYYSIYFLGFSKAGAVEFGSSKYFLKDDLNLYKTKTY